jgi:hypothetical protein
MRQAFGFSHSLGHSMSRGSYETPEPPNPAEAVVLPPQDGRYLDFFDYGDQVKRRGLRPTDFAAVCLAASLADVWLDVAREIPGSASDILSSIKSFLNFLPAQLIVSDHIASFDVPDLRLRHLNSWEKAQAAQVKGSSQVQYRRVIFFFALLRRIESDKPGTLNTDLRERIELSSRLRWKRSSPGPDFSPKEVKKIRSAAHRVVFTALREPKVHPAFEDEKSILCALFALLSLATGEPPEVIRGLKIKDIVATATPGTYMDDKLIPSERLSRLARADLVESFAVTWTKNRAPLTTEVVYGRRDHAAHKAIGDVIRYTAAARNVADLPYFWLCHAQDGRVVEPAWNTKAWRLGGWCSEQGIEISKPQRWGRIRKSIIAREASTDPTYLLSERRHTAQTFFEHYTNSGVLRARAGRILLEAIDENFQLATSAPTVISPDAELLLAAGASAPGLDNALAQDLLNGDLDGPQTACRAPKKSPFAAEGKTCPRSTYGTCFGCGNALITQSHLPAALAIAEMADPARSADPALWLKHWKHIYEVITQVVLPAFPRELIEKARAKIGTVPINPGVLNDMRGRSEGA